MEFSLNILLIYAKIHHNIVFQEIKLLKMPKIKMIIITLNQECLP
jgi:hypothetical protein